MQDETKRTLTEQETQQVTGGDAVIPEDFLGIPTVDLNQPVSPLSGDAKPIEVETYQTWEVIPTDEK